MTLEFLRHGLGHEQTDYRDGWDLQRRIHAEVAAGQRPDTVILLEHASVYTAGKRTEDFERPADGTPVIDVDRGGKITWHGPGQLVGYPIVRLPETVYVVDYVRRLEEAIIALFTSYGLTTGRVPGRSGVWLPAGPSTGSGDEGVSSGHPSTGSGDEGVSSGHPSTGSGREGVERKIAAIGIRVAVGVTMHGFAINVDPDLRWFDNIVPCGILDAGVTSLTAETGARPALTEVADQLEPHLRRYLAFTPYEQSAPLAENPPVTRGLAVGVS